MYELLGCAPHGWYAGSVVPAGAIAHSHTAVGCSESGPPSRCNGNVGVRSVVAKLPGPPSAEGPLGSGMFDVNDVEAVPTLPAASVAVTTSLKS